MICFEYGSPKCTYKRVYTDFLLEAVAQTRVKVGDQRSLSVKMETWIAL